jgi:hypothetical protein
MPTNYCITTELCVSAVNIRKLNNQTLAVTE